MEGLAVVCVVCFASRAFVALLTDIPFVASGSSIPSAFLLWVMREVPPSVTTNVQESATLTFVSDDSTAIQNPQRWTTVASVNIKSESYLTWFLYAKHVHSSAKICLRAGFSEQSYSENSLGNLEDEIERGR
ncbi:hypothetical protein TIFTF001_012509 [Ficus carica]|uniref:Uncharacterized protein n=1 Tax=Ficus carica TaxID=3494 RepID=A0AA88D3S5_FICCA|nr:hypothetical protein TIFTF001_012509 [Ficus carica]